MFRSPPISILGPSVARPLALSAVTLLTAIFWPQSGTGADKAPARPLRTPLVQPNQKPSLTTTLAEGAAALRGEELTFSVTATDPEGGPVSVRLLDPPVGLVFDPLVAGASGTTVTARWFVSEHHGGLQRLRFEVTDQSGARFVLHRTVRVAGASGLLTGSEWPGSPIVFGDVTGDGVQDVVAVAYDADVAGVQDAGAIYIWAGASQPTGAPSATLVRSNPQTGDRLGRHHLRLADLSGDGVLDVVAGSHVADLPGRQDVGGVFVWAGGSALTGTRTPSATLLAASPATFDMVGLSSGEAVQFVDVTGDGFLDVVAGAARADVDVRTDVGQVLVWEGGPQMVGQRTPLAGLTPPDVPSFTLLSALDYDYGESTHFVDLTGDGILDVAVASYRPGYRGLNSIGAMHVWAGGPSLSGAPAPVAVLQDTTAAADSSFGTMRFARGQGIAFVDVTGDGIEDVLVGGRFGGNFHYKVLMWAGGPGLSGAAGPSARLDIPPGGDNGIGWQWVDGLRDVTGDGVVDVIVANATQDGVGVGKTGALYVWAGGASLQGDLAPDFTLTVPGALTGDRLGDHVGSPNPYKTPGGPGVVVRDVTGDGVDDIVACAWSADVNGVPNAGAVYVWVGGATLSAAPTATLTAPGALAGDELGNGKRGLQLADVTGDGVRDVLALAPHADVGGFTDAGAVYVWAGGPGLSGPRAPTATLTGLDSAAIGSDKSFYGPVGFSIGPTMLVGDVTGDGEPDVITSGIQAGWGNKVLAGRIWVWSGGPALGGATAPVANLTVTAPKNIDELGSTGRGTAFQLVDATGDGVLDVVAGASARNLTAALVGGVYVWEGGSGLAGNHVKPVRSFEVPNAAFADRLGWTGGQGIHLVDVTGDRKLDMVVGAMDARVGGVSNTGAIYTWKSVADDPSAFTALTVVGAQADDRLGQ